MEKTPGKAASSEAAAITPSPATSPPTQPEQRSAPARATMAEEDKAHMSEQPPTRAAANSAALTAPDEEPSPAGASSQAAPAAAETAAAGKPAEAATAGQPEAPASEASAAAPEAGIGPLDSGKTEQTPLQ